MNDQTPQTPATPDGAASELTEMLCVSPADIGQVLTSMVRSFDAELLAMTESELDSRWYFRWKESASIEWNLYKFSDALEMFKRSCRKWEEHHNGSCCVVERVRDKYLMPKIRAFAVELKTHNDEAHRKDAAGGLSGGADCSTAT